MPLRKFSCGSQRSVEMKELAQTTLIAFPTMPHHAWKTLTAEQRKEVLHTFVQICHSLIDQSRREVSDEPGPDC